MKRMTFFILFFILTMFTFADKNHVFRNTDWRMTIEQVKKIETAQIYNDKTDGMLEYEGTINKLKTRIIYYFKDNKLYSGKYLITESPTDSKWFKSFDEFKELLKLKYKLVEENDKNWEYTEEYKDIFKDQKTNTEIRLILKQIGKNMYYAIEYYDITYLENEKQQTLDDL